MDGAGEMTTLGPFYGWHRSWPLPALEASLTSGGVVVEAAPPSATQAGISDDELARRLAGGHVPFTARVGNELAAFGWSATERAHIGGLDLHLTILAGERYLWDFATLPRYRGRGLYPFLLQEIMRRQREDAEWFWIGHEPTNDASRRGILKAGFRAAGHVVRQADGTLAFAAAPDIGADAGRRAAAILGLPRSEPGPRMGE